jgi:rhodanese-related sulfurtransferase
MTGQDLLSRIVAGTAPVVIDVRTRREFAHGHIPGAINHPLHSLLLFASNVPASRQEPVIVYCGHGPRARIAAVMLRRAGFRRLELLEGHMAGWRQAGLREER